MGELFQVYDDHDRLLGFVPRSVCHGNPKFIHRTAHVVVFHPVTGDLLLQKRKQTKDIQPGKWDTAVGGHLALGEDYIDGAYRELSEELGLTEPAELKFLFDTKIRNQIESENVRVFALAAAGPFDFQQSEIDEIRFWRVDELKNPQNQELFTPNLREELRQLFTEGILK